MRLRARSIALFISRRNLLEWRTAAQARASPDTLLFYFQLMWPAMAIAGLAIFFRLQPKATRHLSRCPFGSDLVCLRR